MTLCSGLFSQVLTFSSFGFMPVFSMPFFVTLANNRFLYGKHEIGLSLRHDEELGAHSDLLCFESKKDRSSAMTTTTRYQPVKDYGPGIFLKRQPITST